MLPPVGNRPRQRRDALPTYAPFVPCAIARLSGGRFRSLPKGPKHGDAGKPPRVSGVLAAWNVSTPKVLPPRGDDLSAPPSSRGAPQETCTTGMTHKGPVAGAPSASLPVPCYVQQSPAETFFCRTELNLASLHWGRCARCGEPFLSRAFSGQRSASRRRAEG